MSWAEPPEFDVTIGELFPADDVVAQWVFTLNCVADDLAVVMIALKSTKDPERLREQIYFYRTLVGRLYEARRLIAALDTYPDIKEFAGSALTAAGVDLIAAYTRPSVGVKSEVEQLFDSTRHRSVHYAWVGSNELRGLLHDYSQFPAQIGASETPLGVSTMNQWTTVVRAQDSWGGAPWTPGFLNRMKAFGQRVRQLGLAWTMADSMLTMIYSHRRGITLERLVKPEARKRLEEHHGGKFGPGEESLST